VLFSGFCVFHTVRKYTRITCILAAGYYEIEAEFPPAPALITLAKALEVSTDELLGVQPATPTGHELSNKQRLWKRFQKMDVLPTKDQRAVIRLINSLAGSAHAEAS